MNFFAHAMVAYLQRDRPLYVLGAMLPDLSSMASLRIEAIDDGELAAGVALHHETDHRFHACLPFRALCESALVELEGAGVSRGCARAVGHVGSELLLDGVLSQDTAARIAYTQALNAGLDARALDALRFRDGPRAAGLRDLLDWLTHGPLPEGYRDVDFVCDRLGRILARRPRLAMRPADHAPVRAWLGDAAKRVERDAAELLGVHR